MDQVAQTHKQQPHTRQDYPVAITPSIQNKPQTVPQNPTSDFETSKQEDNKLMGLKKTTKKWLRQ